MKFTATSRVAAWVCAMPFIIWVQFRFMDLLLETFGFKGSMIVCGAIIAVILLGVALAYDIAQAREVKKEKP